MNGKRAYNLLKKIGFVRVSGSDMELKAANILKNEIESIKGKATIEAFKVNAHEVTKSSLIADGKEYEVAGYGHCGSTSECGVNAPFYYLEDHTNEVALSKIKGCIVLVNGYLNVELFKALVDNGALGFITYSGSVIKKNADVDVDLRELRQMHIDISGKLPGVHIRAKDAQELVNSNPKSVTVIVKQIESETDSHNVIATIEGSDKASEIITFTAHYDSVPFSTGVYDNGAGSVINMEMYRYFTINKPRRTMKFIWCGSEERGLLGSKAFVKGHENELENIVLSINVDVGGVILGKDSAIVTADESLVTFVKYLAKELGQVISVSQNIYSSDCMPFADAGIPAINFCRFGFADTAYIHSRHDTLAFINAESLYKTGWFIEAFANKLANCEIFPVPRTIPSNIVDEINKYLRKQLLEEAKENKK